MNWQPVCRMQIDRFPTAGVPTGRLPADRRPTDRTPIVRSITEPDVGELAADIVEFGVTEAGGTARSASGARRAGTGGTTSGGSAPLPDSRYQPIYAPTASTDAEQHHGPGGHAPTWHRGGKTQLRQTVDLGGFGAKPPRQLVWIKPERCRVRAQKSDRIGVAGQVGDAALLQRDQERQANPKAGRDGVERPAKSFARGTQIRADARRRGHDAPLCGDDGHIGPTSR